MIHFSLIICVLHIYLMEDILPFYLSVEGNIIIY